MQRRQTHTIDCSSDRGGNVASRATGGVWVKDASSEEDVGGLADSAQTKPVAALSLVTPKQNADNQLLMPAHNELLHRSWSVAHIMACNWLWSQQHTAVYVGRPNTGRISMLRHADMLVEDNNVQHVTDSWQVNLQCSTKQSVLCKVELTLMVTNHTEC